MSLKDFLALTDDKLSATHKMPTFDAIKARKPILAAIDKANAQFGSTERDRSRKAWSVNRGVVEFTLPIAVAGKETHYIPSERFPDALAALKKAIEAGEADAELEKASESGATRSRAAPTGERKARAGWSPERRAKMLEASAAKRAAQGK